MKTSKALQILDNQNVAISPMTDIETVYKEDESGNRQKVAPLILGTNMLSVVNSSNNGKYLTGINIKKSDTSNDFAKIECMMDDISTLIDSVLSNEKLSALSNVTLYGFSAPIRMDSITCDAVSKINTAQIVLDIDKGLEITKDTSKLNVIFPKIRTNNSSNKSFLEFNENDWYLNALIDENTLEIDASNKLHVKDIPIKKLEVSALASWDPSCTADMPKAYLAGTLKTGLFSVAGTKAINEFKIYYTDTYKDVEFDAAKGITCDKTDSNKIIFGLEDCGSEETGKEYGTAIISNGIIKYEMKPGVQGEQGERGADASIPEFNLYKTGDENTSIAKLEYRLIDPIDPNGKGPWIDLGEVNYYYNNVVTNNYNTIINSSVHDNNTSIPVFHNDTSRYDVVNVITDFQCTPVENSSSYNIVLQRSPLDLINIIRNEISKVRTELILEFVPIGTILLWSTDSAPSGYLICDGKEYAQSEYKDLYNLITTTYGSAASGKFKVPDLGGRFAIGRGSDNQGNNYTQNGSIGGKAKVKLQTNEMPEHTHSFKDYYFAESSNRGASNCDIKSKMVGSHETDKDNNYFFYVDNTTNKTGGANEHENRPPYIVLTYIIRAK